MLFRLSQRLLTLLQLTRMALVFTAIADSQGALWLATAVQAPPGAPFFIRLRAVPMVAVAVISIGLYGYGMSLNDIIDRRRDRQISPHRPLPSGRVGIVTAHLICCLLAAAALGAGIVFRTHGGDDLSLILIAITLALITFYDLAGKYLVGPGLLTLGLVRFFHAMIPAARLPHGWAWAGAFGAAGSGPHVAVIWHPLWLLNHVTILSAVAYDWEEKRPPLTKRHWAGVMGSLALIDVLVVTWVGRHGKGTFEQNLDLRPGLALVPLAAAVFVLFAWRVGRRSKTSRQAGQALMLYGLLWLIVYDACFVAAYANLAAALLLLMLLPLAFFSVQLMRWWSKLAAVSQRPAFKRASR